MSTIAIVALGLTLVIVVGEIDLSFGYMYGLASSLVAVSWIVWGWPVWAAILLAFAAAIGVGCFNAFFVTVVKIPSFIVTLGSGQLIFGIHAARHRTRRPSTPPTHRPARSSTQGEIDWFFGLSQPAGPAVRVPDAGRCG